MSSKGADFERIEELAAQWVFRREAGLSAGEEDEFARWLTADPRHADAMARYERAWGNLDRPRLSGQVGQFLERLQRRRRRRHSIRLASLAMIVVMTLTTVFWMRTSRDQGASEGVLVLAPEKRVLDDGSVLELKSGAKVRIEFNAARRQIVLEQGEVHFQVVHQAGRPFYVVAGEVEFRAVGTAFTVQMEPAALALIVTHGTVAVEETGLSEPGETQEASPALPARAPRVLVTAGRRVVVPREFTAQETALKETSLPAEEISEILSWRIPRLEFTETPLRKAVDLLNQYNTVKLVIEDPGLAELRVSGLFRADRVETFVRLLETNFGVLAARTEPGIVLRRLR